MDYSKRLEDLTMVADKMPEFEAVFDCYYRDHSAMTLPLMQLRRIKAFIHEGKQYYRPIFADSKLNATDCLTLAILANLLAYRKKVDTKVARLNGFRALHAVLLYTDHEVSRVFKLSGRMRTYTPKDCVVLSPEEAARRLEYYRPVINFANRLRGRRL